jgi:hypothetical protein
VNETGAAVSNAEVSPLEWLSRIYVVAAGLCWALFASLEFVIAPGRFTPLPEALQGLLTWLAFSCALWLSGFGACRGVLGWVIALVLVGFVGRMVIGIGTGVLSLDSWEHAAWAALGILFAVFSFIAPAALSIVLVLRRPPRTILALERLASSRRLAA